MNKKTILFVFIAYLCLLTKLILFKTHFGSVDYVQRHGFITFQQSLRLVNVIPFKTIIGLLLLKGNNFFVIQNLSGNVLAFIPLGILLPLISPALSSYYKIFAIAFATSLTFELIQLIAVIGIFDVDDIILNTLGGIIGYLIYSTCRRKINLSNFRRSLKT